MNRNWEWIPLAGPLDPETKDFGTANYRDLLANDHYLFHGLGHLGRHRAAAGRTRIALFLHTPRRDRRLPGRCEQSDRPGIECRYAGWREVGKVPGDHRQPVDQRRCGDQRVADRARVGYMELRTRACDGGIDW